MKKITALFIALILCFSCFSVSAVEENADSPEKYDCILGKVGDYSLVYKEPEILLENYKSITLGVGFFCIKSETIPLYLVNENEEIPLEEAYPTVLNSGDITAVVSLTEKALQDKVEPLINGIVDVYLINDNETASASEPSEETEPETTSPPVDEPGGAIAETVDFTQFQPFTEATECTAAEPTEEKPQTEDNKDGNKTSPTASPTNSQGTKINEADIKTAASAKAPRLNFKTATLKCGKTVNLNVKNKGGQKVTFISGNKKVAKVNKRGIITTLKKGRAKITAKVGKKKLYCIVKVVTSPKLSESEISVKKGGYASVKIIGRAASVKNKYKGSEYAEITAKAKADKLKIRGLKRGNTTVKIKVNGVVLKLNVKIK